ncbi:hypothetical protein [Azonexus sp.]|jgi:hypothetical protein|uniref:hypothetical protein n=1 Tax=Azonexus sp. TaxID=1872668 RepID=UPI002836BFAC|nr:hypothetical protein [Azonexus sp.]MDR1995137.1 hypothetical protein [Azonexus sp.]
MKRINVEASDGGQSAANDINNAPEAQTQINQSIVYLHGSQPPREQSGKEARPLVSAQRRQLNQLVKEVAETTGDDPREVWSAIHRIAMVESIDQITAEQFTDCENHLQGRLAEAKEVSECSRLAGRILRLDNARRQKAEAHAMSLYGTSRFVSLNRDQLLTVLREVSSPQEVTCEHDCTACRQTQREEFERAAIEHEKAMAKARHSARWRGWLHVAIAIVAGYFAGQAVAMLR